MAAKKQEKKRKQNSDAKNVTDSLPSKKPKLNEKFKKPFDPSKKLNDKSKLGQSKSGNDKNAPETKRERRIRAKELAEARKKKRKRHYTLEQELASLWEKMRQRNISKEDRSKYISEALQKMKGKIPEIASSHVSSRVLQTCVKYCSQTERDAVFEELKPHFLTFSCNTYAVHLVKKMLDNASKKQLAEFISSLRGHVASLLRHMVGSVVIEHAYQLGNATQKQELLLELYSAELQLFKDLTLMKESRLLDVVSKLKLQKASVLRHMTSVIQPILEKGIVDHSIIHRVLIEYLSMADKSSAAEVIQQLSGPLLVRMIHTRDGSRIGILCVKYGSAKERKKIVKGMKGHIGKIAHDRYGSLIGRCPLLQLLHPNCSRYFSPDDMAAFSLSILSLSAKSELEVKSETKSLNDEASSDEADAIAKITTAGANESASSENADFIEGGKKDPSIRRHELLVGSGLAENLIDVCIENAGELLRSNFGKEVLYEVATGGAGGILHSGLDDKLNTLHEAIASLAAEPKSEESEQEHVLENFYSSRTIRKLIMDSSTFAATLWMKALKGRCELWAQGHSSKVIYAFLESSDAKISKLVSKELQPLIDSGILKVPEHKKPGKEG
ncbi:Protein penguin, putative [Ricinus communis]|uniref:Protein penguin, putative n=1 Tax=Ricinus communis TaxID=3988 RepID=B9RTB1_RICCO|nr:Protein penguin, putative [Ricinus communis]